MKDNQCIQIFKNKSIVEDHMKANMNSSDTFNIYSGLVQSVKSSRKAHEAAFEEKNKNKKIADKEVSIKPVDSDISDLKSKIDALKKILLDTG